MLRVGFARVDITPPLGSPLAGYYEARHADGVLDPIELNALAFCDGNNTVVLIVGDLLYVTEMAATPIREKVSAAVGISAENVIVQGLHQHTSVRVGERGTFYTDSLRDAAYLDVLYRKYCDVARMAIDDLHGATVGVAENETAVPLSFVRRFRMKDGSLRTNPGRLNGDVSHPIGEADNTVRLVRFFREDANDIALVNFSTHPDVINGNKISADWPGFVRRITEKELPNVHCVLVNGCQGDTNHIDISKPDLGMTNYDYSRFMGQIIVDTLLPLWENTNSICATPIRAHVEMQYIPTNTVGMDEVEKFKKIAADYEAGLLPDLSLDDCGEFERISTLYEEKLFQKVPVTAVRMGDMGIFGFGGEPFTQYAADVREAHPDLFLIAACLVNGGEGYLPTKEAFDEGGFEAKSSRFTPCVEEVLTTCASALLN